MSNTIELGEEFSSPKEGSSIDLFYAQEILSCIGAISSFTSDRDNRQKQKELSKKLDELISITRAILDELVNLRVKLVEEFISILQKKDAFQIRFYRSFLDDFYVKKSKNPIYTKVDYEDLHNYYLKVSQYLSDIQVYGYGIYPVIIAGIGILFEYGALLKKHPSNTTYKDQFGECQFCLLRKFFEKAIDGNITNSITTTRKEALTQVKQMWTDIEKYREGYLGYNVKSDGGTGWAYINYYMRLTGNPPDDLRSSRGFLFNGVILVDPEKLEEAPNMKNLYSYKGIAPDINEGISHMDGATDEMYKVLNVINNNMVGQINKEIDRVIKLDAEILLLNGIPQKLNTAWKGYSGKSPECQKYNNCSV